MLVRMAVGPDLTNTGQETGIHSRSDKSMHTFIHVDNLVYPMYVSDCHLGG